MQKAFHIAVSGVALLAIGAKQSAEAGVLHVDCPLATVAVATAPSSDTGPLLSAVQNLNTITDEVTYPFPPYLKQPVTSKSS